MEWRPAGWSVCLPLLILPCTIKSRSSLLALAHPDSPRKRAVKRLWWCYHRFISKIAMVCVSLCKLSQVICWHSDNIQQLTVIPFRYPNMVSGQTWTVQYNSVLEHGSDKWWWQQVCFTLQWLKIHLLHKSHLRLPSQTTTQIESSRLNRVWVQFFLLFSGCGFVQ